MFKFARGFASVRKETKGFTLVELMVTITIIAILATVGLVVFSQASNQAKQAKVKADMQAISENIEIARFRSNDVLGHITGSFCSECQNSTLNGHNCRVNGTNDPGCIDVMRKAYVKVMTVLGSPATEMPLDPWGGAYTWDENELQPNLLVCCHNPPPAGAGNVNTVQDFMTSGGPNHVISYVPGSGAIHKEIAPKYCNYATAARTATCACTPGLNCAPPWP